MVKVEVISDECVCMSLDHQYSEISIVGGWPAGSLLLDNIIYVVLVVLMQKAVVCPSLKINLPILDQNMSKNSKNSNKNVNYLEQLHMHCQNWVLNNPGT